MNVSLSSTRSSILARLKNSSKTLDVNYVLAKEVVL